jgi:hypothetical protein
LDSLDGVVAAGHEEVMDTAVREQLHEAVFKTLVEPEAGYRLPEEFGMFSEEGNAKVRRILGKFLAHPEVEAAKKLGTAKERLEAFGDLEVESSEGTTYDEYFGYNDSFE